MKKFFSYIAIALTAVLVGCAGADVSLRIGEKAEENCASRIRL